ncbi:MAG: MFS transporter [Treponema sp.]|nr:MFS transporter [Treponema sp.]
MFLALLIVIYISFISLGLPDSILGSAWPVMFSDFNVPLSYAGIISMIIAGNTVISSLCSSRLIKKFGTGITTFVSVLITAIALFGFSISSQFFQLCLWAIPYGLGAGCVDAGLNNFVALHYKSRHMSWLHCFWGLGAMIGPYIMGFTLSNGNSWNMGYKTISIIQIILVIILFFSLPLWKKISNNNNNLEESIKPKVLSLPQVFALKGAKNVFIAFFCYCALESTAGLWASSYLVIIKGLDVSLAAKFASLFYIGITAGRFLCGFISEKLGDRNMIRLGQGIIFTGLILLFIPTASSVPLIALILIGLGCAPIYPSLIHSTPIIFGAENSQSLIGIQMATAYIGSTFMPSIFGFLSTKLSVSLYPVYLLFFLILMIVMTEFLIKILHEKRS